MDQRAFIILNATLIVVVLLIFLRGRKKEGPSRLNLNTQGKISESGEGGAPLAERSINVIFQYNGHSWDAYEVLGISAGTSKGEAEVAADKLIKSASRDQKKFYMSAIDAIRKS